MKGITQIKETCMYIEDIDQAIHFYHDTLGFPLISKVNGRHAFFRVGTSVLLCFVAEVTKRDKKLPPHFAYGNQHIAFEVDSDHYQSWKVKLVNLGIEIIHTELWREGIESFYFLDPENNVLEVVITGMWEY